MYQLIITVAFNQNLTEYINKVIEIDPGTAKELHIKEGQHEAGIVYECEKGLKVTYRGAFLWLPKDKIVVSEG